MSKPLVAYLTSAWTSSLAIGAIFLLVRGAQAAGIDGAVTGVGLAAVAAIGGVTGTYRLTHATRP